MLDLVGGGKSLLEVWNLYICTEKNVSEGKFQAANHFAYGNGYWVNCNPILLQSFLPSFPPTEVHSHTCTPQHLRSPPEPSTPLAPARLLSHNQHLSSHLCPSFLEGSGPHPHSNSTALLDQLCLESYMLKPSEGWQAQGRKAASPSAKSW